MDVDYSKRNELIKQHKNESKIKKKKRGIIVNHEEQVSIGKKRKMSERNR